MRERKIHVLSCGYDHVDRDSLNRFYFGRDAHEMADALGETFDPKSKTVISNTNQMRRRIESALERLKAQMTGRDALFCYFSVHGNENEFDIAKTYQAIHTYSLEGWEKRHLVEKIAKVPGLKIVMMDTCNADHNEIPEDMIWIASSQIDQTSTLQFFKQKITRELSSTHPEDPFASFMTIIRQKLHNYPLHPMPASLLDWQYNTELKTGKVGRIFRDVPRITVRPNTFIDGIKVEIDPRCNFL